MLTRMALSQVNRCQYWVEAELMVLQKKSNKLTKALRDKITIGSVVPWKPKTRWHQVGFQE